MQHSPDTPMVLIQEGLPRGVLLILAALTFVVMPTTRLEQDRAPSSSPGTS
ncbi:hypothetical protein [Deinococcus sp. AJ005]|uniref:hypothetical protein n=1 Tax=Deinococcus sp. AJ005 TaxID=2652443 RepID=UPI0018656E02|nr:hypothetical protein [Deinococcus sp. AJ005]